MRIFAASLATETNTFSPIPTSRGSFEEAFYAPAGQHRSCARRRCSSRGGSQRRKASR